MSGVVSDIGECLCVCVCVCVCGGGDGSSKDAQIA